MNSTFSIPVGSSEWGDPACLKVERCAQGVLQVQLHDPQRFNVLSANMLEALQQVLDSLGADTQVRVLILSAAGKAFCAGHDLKAMASATQQAAHEALFRQCSKVMLSLQKLPVPVIARVQGLATAAGCQLVAQCDLAVASETARFATSGIQYGLFCATPSVPLVRNIGFKQAMEMLLTGDFIDAQTAQEQGLVNHVVPEDELDAVVDRLVRSVLAKPREAIAMGKALLYQQREMGIEAAYQLASHTMAVNMMSPCAQEGAQAFVEKRAPSWR